MAVTGFYFLPIFLVTLVSSNSALSFLNSIGLFWSLFYFCLQLSVFQHIILDPVFFVCLWIHVFSCIQNVFSSIYPCKIGKGRSSAIILFHSESSQVPDFPAVYNRIKILKFTHFILIQFSPFLKCQVGTMQLPNKLVQLFGKVLHQLSYP